MSIEDEKELIEEDLNRLDLSHFLSLVFRAIKMVLNGWRSPRWEEEVKQQNAEDNKRDV